MVHVYFQHIWATHIDVIKILVKNKFHNVPIPRANHQVISISSMIQSMWAISILIWYLLWLYDRDWSVQIGCFYHTYLVSTLIRCICYFYACIVCSFTVDVKNGNFVQFLGKILSGDHKILKVDKILLKKIWVPFGITLGWALVQEIMFTSPTNCHLRCM